MKANLLAAIVGGVTAMSAIAATEPRPSERDVRIGTIAYTPNDVATVHVRRGSATTIVFSEDEKIQLATAGLSARCDHDEDEWCIRATEGSNEVLVRPKAALGHTNLEIRTNIRRYSIEFQVLPDEPAAIKHRAPTSGPEPFYRVVYTYPQAACSARLAAIAQVLGALQATPNAAPAPNAASAGMSAQERVALEPARVRNSNYTMQILEHGEDAAPTLVFDDGRFTYFEFRGAREIPAIFAVMGDGEPVRVNWHMEGHFVVAERTARKFTLRNGNAVTGVFNEAFDAEGIDTPTATVSASVRRDVREEKQ